VADDAPLRSTVDSAACGASSCQARTNGSSRHLQHDFPALVWSTSEHFVSYAHACQRQDGPDLWEDLATFEPSRNRAEPRRRKKSFTGLTRADTEAGRSTIATNTDTANSFLGAPARWPSARSSARSQIFSVRAAVRFREQLIRFTPGRGALTSDTEQTEKRMMVSSNS
jgi:hypothetical protein